MGEIKIFVEPNPNESIIDKVIICQSNADKIGVQNGDTVEIYNSENNLKKNAIIEVSEKVLEFAGEFSKNILNELSFTGIELILRPARAPKFFKPTVSVPDIVQPELTPLPQNPRQIVPLRMSQPMPPSQPPLKQEPQPMQGQIPQLTPLPQPIPEKTPHLVSSTQMAEMPVPEVKVEQFPNKIDINVLKGQKNGIALKPVTSPIEGGRVQLSLNNLQRLGLGQGMLIGWEDPLTRSIGSARLDQAMISDDEIRMSKDTIEDTDVKAEQIVVYSTEPPIQKASEIFLEVQSQANLNGYCQVSPRTQYTLSLQNNDIIAFEDELTGAVGAGKVQILENVSDVSIIIDSEILEASGIGSFEVKVTKNQRQVIPLQSISLGISPISGEKMWENISAARQNINNLKNWLSNYIIFKGIKLRWAPLNIACSILNCVPDLTGDILAQVSPNTTLALSPTGLVPFNAILILDISRSMMARDVQVKNIAPAIEGIKAAMESREIQEFLKNFKEGINIPRRISAAFAAVLFLSEKVGRGFGEKVSVIRFADEAQLLPFGDSFYMDSASGKKGVLEEAARMIVDHIGNSYGQSTNMGAAMVKAYEVLLEFQRVSPDQPTMIVILTDGIPTDPQNFFEAIKLFSENPNVVIYIVGLGNPDDDMMTRAAQLCGGEYFKPQDAGELLVWYSKRARDLTVKLKAHKK